MVDLCDYWLSAPGSVTADPDRNFWFAVNRATWMGLAFLGQETSLRDSHTSLDDLMEMDQEPHTVQGPEDDVIEEEMRERAFDLVQELSDDQAGWLKGHLLGLTCRDEALESGVHHATVARRRNAALAELQRRAVETEVA